MANFIDPKTWMVKEVLTASDMNTYVRDNVNFLNNPPSCCVYNNGNIAVPDASYTGATFNSEYWDTDNMHSTSSNTGNLYCNTPGLYEIFLNIRWRSNASGYRQATILKSGGVIIARKTDFPTTNIASVFPLSTQDVLDIGDYVYVQFYQTSGTELRVEYHNRYSPVFGMTYLGKV